VIDPERCIECIGHYDEPECVALCLAECISVGPERGDARRVC
jgi:hypothetical protein